MGIDVCEIEVVAASNRQLAKKGWGSRTLRGGREQPGNTAARRLRRNGGSHNCGSGQTLSSRKTSARNSPFASTTI